MAAEKTVKVKFDGSSKGLAAAAAVAAKVTERWAKQLGQVKKRAEDWSKSGDSAGKRFAGKAALALGALVSAAGKVGSGMMSAVSGAVSAAGPLLKGVLVAVLAAAAAAAAPVIAAAITTGVLLGVGGGVLAMGIKLAAGSPKVKKAADSLKSRFMDIDTTDLEANYVAAQGRMSTATGKEAKKRAAAELREAKKALDEANAYNKKNFSLKDAAKPFIEPLTKALNTFQAAADRVIPRFASMFKALAPSIDKLAPALVSMAEKALPGIEKAAKASAPLFDKLAEVLPGLGKQIGLFFSIISDGSPESSQLIGDMVKMLGNVLVGVAAVIRWLTQLYSWARTVWIGVGGFIKAAVRVGLDALGMLISGAAKAFGWIPGLGPKLKQAALEFNAFAAKVNRALAGIKDKTVGVDVAIRVTGNRNSSAVAHALRKQNIPGFATGGWARGMYLAGENGPELIASGGGGGAADRVHSNRQTESMFNPEVRVYIGDQELRGIVRVEMSDRDRGVKRRVRAGSGAR